MPSPRGFLRSLRWIALTTLTIVGLAFCSLFVTSDPLTHDQQRLVTEAIALVEQGGFGREATVLRRVVFFRSTDNWWNMHVGHQNAYAATNYPFAVVTLYPAFFRFSSDATERAAILLHEAQHVFGVGRAPGAAARLAREATTGLDRGPLQPHARLEEHTGVDDRRRARALSVRDRRTDRLRRVADDPAEAGLHRDASVSHRRAYIVAGQVVP